MDGIKGLSGNLPGQVHYGIQGPPGPKGNTGNPGADGGYYKPSVTQPEENKIQIDFVPSKADMPAVEPVQVTLPAGQGSGGNVELDTTLTQSGTAADAKAVGDALSGKLSSDALPEAINTALSQAKASGEFDGADGEKGEKGDKGDKGDTGETGAKGDPGYTPVKGTDYYTAADKTEMVNAVLAALPAAEGVSY